MICQDRSFTSSIKRIICNCCELDNVNSHCNRNAASIFAKHPLGELGGALRCRKLDSNVTIQLSLLGSEKMRALFFYFTSDKKLSCASFQITKCLCDADVLFMFVESLFHPFRSKYLRRKLWQTGLDFKEG